MFSRNISNLTTTIKWGWKSEKIFIQLFPGRGHFWEMVAHLRIEVESINVRTEWIPSTEVRYVFLSSKHERQVNGKKTLYSSTPLIKITQHSDQLGQNIWMVIIDHTIPLCWHFWELSQAFMWNMARNSSALIRPSPSL